MEKYLALKEFSEKLLGKYFLDRGVPALAGAVVWGGATEMNIWIKEQEFIL